jgi:predicted  nucleic acid-binding Zn-ribbon protein
MSSVDVINAQNGVSQEHPEVAHALTSATNTVSAVEGLLAVLDRVKEERDEFQRQLSDARAESESLRAQIIDARKSGEGLSKTVSIVTDEMESIASRCLEAVKSVRAQLSEPAPLSLPSSSSEGEQRSAKSLAASATSQSRTPHVPDQQHTQDLEPNQSVRGLRASFRSLSGM